MAFQEDSGPSCQCCVAVRAPELTNRVAQCSTPYARAHNRHIGYAFMYTREASKSDDLHLYDGAQYFEYNHRGFFLMYKNEGPQYGTCSMSPVGSLEFGGVS
jgi:hypothetical protein